MEKEMISSGKMTFKFIWHFILYSLILSIITGFIYSLIYSKISNIIIMNIIMLMLSGISIFIATKLSIKDIFSDKQIKENDIKKYKRNVIIFFIICILLTLFYYALVYSITALRIDQIASTLVIADNQDITSAINKIKNMQLVITCASGVIKSFIYIGMMKYQDKYINKKD